jgi:hypothetical protein
VKKPARRFSEVVAWSDETVDRIVEAHPERFRHIPLIGSAAGLRQGEIFGLSVDDFDFEAQAIRVRRQVKRLGNKFVFALPKNDKERIVPMSAVLARMAKAHIGNDSVRRRSRCRGATRRRGPESRPALHLVIRKNTSGHACTTWSSGSVRSWRPRVLPPAEKDNRGRLRYNPTERPVCTRSVITAPASLWRTGSTSKSSLSTSVIYDPGFTLQIYTHMLPSSHDRAGQAVDRRLERLAARLAELGRSTGDSTAAGGRLGSPPYTRSADSSLQRIPLRRRLFQFS